jgi:hypothetical protein
VAGPDRSYARYFFTRELRPLEFPFEPRWREIASTNSAMDGVPNARGLLRDSGKPVIGLSMLDLSTSLIAPRPRVVRDAEGRRLHVARILAAPLTGDGHGFARVIGSLVLAGRLLCEPALLYALKRTDGRCVAAVSVHQQYKDD